MNFENLWIIRIILLLVFLVTQNGTWNLCSRNRLRDVVVWTSSWTFIFKYLSLTEALRDAVFSETIPSSSQKLASKTTSGFLAVTADEALGRWRLFGYRTSSRACAVEGKSTEKSLNENSYMIMTNMKKGYFCTWNLPLQLSRDSLMYLLFGNLKCDINMNFFGKRGEGVLAPPPPHTPLLCSSARWFVTLYAELIVFEYSASITSN